MKRMIVSVVPLVLAAGLFFVVDAARAQIPPEGLDHLKCYQIEDSLLPQRFIGDLRNQFGLEPNCVIATPARLFCAETEKQITSDPQPPGGGPSGNAAGHFLCYYVRCRDTETPAFGVEDQFGRRRIRLERARILCAPANKFICGDGNLDPGEACDPTDPNHATCPSGDPCPNTCSCPVQDCCQCPDGCFPIGSQPCPSGCTPASGVCTSAGVCEECVCGDECTDPNGLPGHCRPTGSVITDPCSCVADPPVCACGDECTTPDGVTGKCRPVAGSNLCRCVPPPPPPDCQCGEVCTTTDGIVGKCRPVPGTNICRCQPPPPPPKCPCDATCTDENGNTGFCRPDPNGPAGVCACKTILGASNRSDKAR